MTYLEFVNNNLGIYLALIIALLILDIILSIICIKQRKRRNIKHEFEEVEKIIAENEQAEETNIKPEVAFELEAILKQMQQDIDTKPEDVVRHFEEEQEKQAIISYQELVDSVNNNKIDVVDDEEGSIDFVAALEASITNPSLEVIKDIKDNPNPSFDDNINEPVMNVVEDLHFKEKSHLDVIDELDFDDEPKKFRNSEILSPVFGRMQPEFEYRKIATFAPTNNKIEIEQVSGDTAEVDLKKNEDFLKALIDFRNNL